MVHAFSLKPFIIERPVKVVWTDQPAAIQVPPGELALALCNSSSD